MNKYTLYILECADGSFYTGITTDVERRLAQHKSGLGAHYTRSRGVKKIVYTETGLTHSRALKREVVIKKLTRVQKRILIDPDFAKQGCN